MTPAAAGQADHNGPSLQGRFNVSARGRRDARLQAQCPGIAEQACADCQAWQGLTVSVTTPAKAGTHRVYLRLALRCAGACGKSTPGGAAGIALRGRNKRSARP